jgi:hypothetical protein
VDNGLLGANGFGRILIGKLQVIFPSTPSILELSASAEGTSVDFVGSPVPRVAMPPIVPMRIASEPQTDRAEEAMVAQRWERAREHRFQTIRAMRLLREVHERSLEQLRSLATLSVPLSQGDDTRVVGRLFLTATDVPPLATDEDEELTDRDAEGEVAEGED